MKITVENAGKVMKTQDITPYELELAIRLALEVLEHPETGEQIEMGEITVEIA